MSIKSSIVSEIQRLAQAEDKELPPLTDDVALSALPLDSLALAILVARLEEMLGLDPFTDSGEAFYPVTLGDFIGWYERADCSR